MIRCIRDASAAGVPSANELITIEGSVMVGSTGAVGKDADGRTMVRSQLRGSGAFGSGVPVCQNVVRRRINRIVTPRSRLRHVCLYERRGPH